MYERPLSATHYLPRACAPARVPQPRRLVNRQSVPTAQFRLDLALVCAHAPPHQPGPKPRVVCLTSMSDPLPTEVVNEVSDLHWPADLGKSRYHRRKTPLFLEMGMLDETHIQAMRDHLDSGQPLAVKPIDLKQIRQSHHRLAILLAGGANDITAGRLCNYTPARVSQLKRTPAFQELLAHYASEAQTEWAEFIVAAKDLSMDLLQEISRRLDEEPEKISNQQLNDLLRTVSDRAGHAPVNKTLNVNANLDFGSRLRAAQERQRRLAEG